MSLSISSTQASALITQMDSKIVLSRSRLRQMSKTKVASGTSLAVWWLRLHTANAAGMGLIPGWGTKIPHAVKPK